MPVKLRYTDYTVAWITAVPIELSAALAVLDEQHERLPWTAQDQEAFSYGSIHGHNIVIGCAGKGKVSAATLAIMMTPTFPSLQIRLLVGIGAGVSRMEKHNEQDIRLGDVIVSIPTDHSPGVVQYDLGKAREGGVYEQTGTLDRPPRPLLSAVDALRADLWAIHSKDWWCIGLPFLMACGATTGQNGDLVLPEDRLFQADYSHEIEMPDSSGPPCMDCMEDFEVPRKDRGGNALSKRRVHYGSIASGDTIIRDGVLRDTIASKSHALCFEMEASGLMNSFRCLVIRGIGNYADSHKNDAWQPYAALSAAVYARSLLEAIAAPEKDSDVQDSCAGSSHPPNEQDCFVTQWHARLGTDPARLENPTSDGERAAPLAGTPRDSSRGKPIVDVGEPHETS